MGRGVRGPREAISRRRQLRSRSNVALYETTPVQRQAFDFICSLQPRDKRESQVISGNVFPMVWIFRGDELAFYYAARLGDGFPIYYQARHLWRSSSSTVLAPRFNDTSRAPQYPQPD